ncbi:MAG: hypothetical protein DRH57_05600 [Candidatus Cloacimonadota bacterium]|nr:MAG: hypothetical protein DRH57_05600 [Candidatus Cloacimonadota bacterium]
MKDNKDIRKQIRTLRKEREEFKKTNFKANELKRDFDLDDSDLEKIGLTRRFGEERYLRDDIFRYLSDKKG